LGATGPAPGAEDRKPLLADTGLLALGAAAGCHRELLG